MIVSGGIDVVFPVLEVDSVLYTVCIREIKIWKKKLY